MPLEIVSRRGNVVGRLTAHDENGATHYQVDGPYRDGYRVLGPARRHHVRGVARGSAAADAAGLRVEGGRGHPPGPEPAGRAPGRARSARPSR